MVNENDNPFIFEWNGIKVHQNRFSIEKGEIILTQNDLEKIKTDIQLEDASKYIGTGGGLQAAIWASNKKKLIAHVLKCSESDLKYIPIERSLTYDKEEMIETHNTEIILYCSGVLIGNWNGRDFGDIDYYFVTKKKG